MRDLGVTLWHLVVAVLGGAVLIFAVIAGVALVMSVPATLYAKQRCVALGYPSSDITWKLDVYCRRWGDSPIPVEKIEAWRREGL